VRDVAITQYPRRPEQNPATRWSDSGWVDQERRGSFNVLAEPVGRNFARRAMFYDPMAVSAFAGQMNEAAIVYDCMDSFLNSISRRRMAKRERNYSLWRSRLRRRPEDLAENVRFNSNCFSFGCGSK